ncbi:haloacid dehalogenase [Bosea sp. Tri-39]|nr:haloacid dehalogenase [Bosea sp. Tri-49]RXT17340.1 haloacid dehalogenase [Bosea sp. Tri-39]RXT40711.1 haloacid dehalogenase [Bosea sp. Tri-54]
MIAGDLMGSHAIRGVLFDKDGTLIDYQASWAPTNLKAGRLAAQGDPELAARLLTVAGVDPATGYAISDGLLASGNTEDVAEAWAEAGSPFGAAELTERLDTLFCSVVVAAVPVCDLAALFASLSGRGILLGIASSDSEVAVAATAERFGLEPHLAFLCGYDSGHGAKPGRGMVDGFCRTTGLPTEAVAVIGDSTHDMHMAAAAGAGLRIAVLTGAGSAETLRPLSHLLLPSIATLEQALFG